MITLSIYNAHFQLFFIAFSVVLLSNAMPLNDRIEDFDLLTNMDYYDQL